MRARTATSLALLGILISGAAVSASEPPRVVDVLIYTETAGYRHSSIDEGAGMLKLIADTDPISGVDVRVAETGDSATHFTDAGLKDFEVVAFISNTGDPLSATEKTAFEKWITAGGAFLGIHASSDAGYTWPFYRDLVGGTFISHPAIQQAKVLVEDANNVSTAHLPKEWVRTDEWYNFRRNPRAHVCHTDEEAPGVQLETIQPAAAPDLPPPAIDQRPKNCKVHVLATLDETSYSNNGDKMGDHPISWCQSYRGGRTWYTAMGHTEASFVEQPYIQHVIGGIKIAAGLAPCSA